MANQPVITFRSNTAPYGALSSLTYQKTFYGNVLPVLNFNDSDTLQFRIYNNWALASAIATAINVTISVYDQTAATSASTAAASQLWTHVYEDMYGESTGGGVYQFTAYGGMDTPVGGSQSYALEVGSDGTSNAYIRAGSNGNGWGFIEVSSYLTPPAGVIAQSYSFGVICFYQWIT